jgi:fucose 4-O-acetylase-like acetyltransferase
VTSQTHNRIMWIDSAKGIGITLVVIGHVLRGIVSSDLLNAEDPHFQWFDFSIYTFHMPLFFFLSGVTVEASLRKGRRQFFTGRLWTVVYPYILWSLIVGSLLIAFSTREVTPLSLALIPIYPVSIFWFLYVLLMCHVVFALWPERYRKVLYIISISALVLAQFVPDSSWKVWPPIFHFARCFPFYLTGYFLSNWTFKAQANLTWLAILTAVLAGAILGAHAVVGWKYTSIVALPAGVAGVALVITAAKMVRGQVAGLLTLLGTSSMTIYVTHTIIGALARKVLSNIHVYSVPIHLILGTIAAILLPTILHGVLKHFGILYIFGLGARPKANT